MDPVDRGVQEAAVAGFAQKGLGDPAFDGGSAGRVVVAEDLAALVGYTEYYLTHKFKEETGLSVTNYVKFAKVERAKVLLKSTPLSVREISEQLGFATRNYFSAVFQQVTGKTPMEFRET